MDNKILTVVITLVLGIILTGALLVPVLNDAEHAGAESHTNGTNYMKEANGTVEMILTNQQTITSEGEVINGYGYSGILTDTFWATINISSFNIFWFDGISGHFSSVAGANVTIDAEAKTITLSDISHASSNDNITGDTLTVSYNSTCFYRSTNGDYVSVGSEHLSDARVLDNSPVYAVAYSSGKVIYWNGTEVSENGTVSSTPGTITLTPSTPSEFNTVAASFGSVNGDKYILPSVIWTEGAMDNASLSILHILPVLVIVSLILGCVTLVIRRD